MYVKENIIDFLMGCLVDEHLQNYGEIGGIRDENSV